MKKIFYIIFFSCLHFNANAAGNIQKRCGWFQNPTPQNAVLTDREGMWVIATQGAASADGDWPEFNDKQWVKTGAGSYGYGCACLKVKVKTNRQTRIVERIYSAKAKPLSACRRDKNLKGFGVG